MNKVLNPFVARRKRDTTVKKAKLKALAPADQFDEGVHDIDKTIKLGETQEQAAARILDEITAREEDCLKTIHTRYCIIKALPISIGDLGCYTPDKRLRPTYREYWYKWQTKNQAFLMSRETVIENGEIKLRIIFNRDIARTGENDQRGFEAPC